MAGIDIMGGLNKAFLATVGAVAITAEKSQQAVEDLVKRVSSPSSRASRSTRSSRARPRRPRRRPPTARCAPSWRLSPTRTAPPTPPRSPR
ncbi:MAG: hypothetical protein ACLTZW_00245 [Paratractidigestivibacter faecalis]